MTGGAAAQGAPPGARYHFYKGLISMALIQQLADYRDLPLDRQIRVLGEILTSSGMLRYVIASAQDLGVHDYYIGAGCIAQTVWNQMHGFQLEMGIKDIDVAFFDADRPDWDFENEIVERANVLWGHLGLQLDVKNQARVHLWYEQRFGYSIPPYRSLEAALNTWPTTATAIGIRAEAHGNLTIYAPFGLNDLLSGIVRPNKAQITRDIYEAKVERWRKVWPGLQIISWDDSPRPAGQL